MNSIGRVALVTGGSRGLGAAITRSLASAGVHVAIAYVSNATAAQELKAEVEGTGGSVSLHQGNVGRPAACQSIVADVQRLAGRIDHLICNAGALHESPLGETTDEQWRTAVDVNLSSAFYLTRAVLPPMLAEGFGRIVYVSSVTAVMGSPVEAAYGAAKAGLMGLTRSVAREVARKGITVNCVIPGVFDTDMTASMPVSSQEAIRRLIPLGRRGDPGELAHAVQFLVDDRASYVTGSIVTVDGGLSMGG